MMVPSGLKFYEEKSVEENVSKNEVTRAVAILRSSCELPLRGPVLPKGFDKISLGDVGREIELGVITQNAKIFPIFFEAEMGLNQ